MKNVLLIDDNVLQLRTREAVLRGAGLQVLTATSADSALALLRDGTIGSVVTDHIMPDVSGAEFVRRLRAINTDVPVIVISGMAEAGDEYVGLNVIFRQKPIPPKEMIELVRQTLAG